MDSLGRKLAKGLPDDVTILKFDADTAKGKIFQHGNVILRKLVVETVREIIKGLRTLSASRYIDLGEGGGVSL